jgi:quinol-cytochrome oxidoreductase complex cytochrome b subunit
MGVDMADIAQQPGGAAPNTIDEAKRQKLLELVRGRAMARPTDLAEDEVMVWPSLVVIEAVCATVFLLLTVLLSILVSAPLTARANANQTPNPSKAPWYFLNLQELLLHMDPGLAGVVVPTLALGAIAAIPYIDRSPLGVGILGTSAKGRKIIGFSFVWTTVVIIAAIMLNEQTGRTVFGLSTKFIEKYGPNILITGWVLPTIFMLVNIAIFAGAVKAIFKPTTREFVIGMFTAFVAAYVVLTLSGTSFRGEGQNLTWPWNLPLKHH